MKPDRENAIKALEERIIEANPWKDQPPLRCDISYPLLVDVLELLKEQDKRIKELELEKGWDESPDMMGKW